PGALSFVTSKKNRPKSIDACIDYFGTKINRDCASDALFSLLFDPQTSGGLLISVSPEKKGELISSLKAAGVEASEIGELIAPDPDWTISVR
ncbi:MAG: AIR synthase-related protein, partial [Thermodesulfobacteriota bacterium]